MSKLTYTQLLESVKAFIPNNPYIITIIKTCGLQPVDGWRSWNDGADNKLVINNYKEVNVKINKEASVLTNNIRDIYFKSDIDLVLKNSSYVSIALCDDMKTYFFWFKGNDGWLRFLSYKDGNLNHLFPLTSGINALRYIFINETANKVVIKDRDNNKFNISILPWTIPEPYNLTIKKTWNSFLPISYTMKKELLMNNNEDLLNLIGG
jgi:hypothetical protein